MRKIFEIEMDAKISGEGKAVLQFQAGFVNEAVADKIPGEEMDKIGELITEITSIISRCIGGSEPTSSSSYVLEGQEHEIYNSWSDKQKEMFKDAPIEIKKEIMEMEKELLGKTDEEKMHIMLDKIADELKKAMNFRG